MMTIPYFQDDAVTLWHGDCLDVLRTLPDSSVDSVVTDPPYGLGFMGKAWDDLPPGLPWARECLRVLKPGGHLLAFGGSRTSHRLACAVEDAGFEIRDSIAWLYGSGFPKSLDVSKAIDKHLTPRDPRDLTEEYRFTAWMRATGITSAQINVATASQMGGHYLTPSSQPAVPTEAMLDLLRPLLPEVPEWVELLVVQREQEKAEARSRQEAAWFLDTLQLNNTRTVSTRADAERWQGWGTALKPAFEPIIVGRKPLVGTVAANVLAHGTGALNIDGCRIPTTDSLGGGIISSRVDGWDRPCKSDPAAVAVRMESGAKSIAKAEALGRWPANVVLDGSQADALDAQSGTLTSGANPTRRGADGARTVLGAFAGQDDANPQRGQDSGGASRFFPTFRYEAKAPTLERPRAGDVAHPTVKPLDLMRWLVRLVTPPGGTVLEPFAGSGTTAEACILEGFLCIAIEREADYLPLIVQRISKPLQVGLGLDFGGVA
jgi:DNA modification methylase